MLETHTFCKIPTPGEFLAPIRGEWYERKDLLKRIQLHKSRLELSDNLKLGECHPEIFDLRIPSGSSF